MSLPVAQKSPCLGFVPKVLNQPGFSNCRGLGVERDEPP